MLRHPPPTKKRPAYASLFVSRDATSRMVFNFNPLWPQAGTRGVASRFTVEAFSANPYFGLRRFDMKNLDVLFSVLTVFS